MWFSPLNREAARKSRNHVSRETRRRLWRQIAISAGFDLDDHQLDLLERFCDWLEGEAIPAGGLGPEEASRLDDRHIGDSLLFAWPFSTPPATLVDLGSGVGLPGIPLAILWPDTEVTLLDKSAGRLQLARRALRVLGLANVLTIQAEIGERDDVFDAIVTRAAIPPDDLPAKAGGILRRGGSMIAGGSWLTRPDVPGWETQEIRVEMLDRPVWLLIMRRA